MNRVAEFEKVSYKQFEKDYVNLFGINTIIDMKTVKHIYDQITIPERATKGSAGYDFITPINIKLNPGEKLKYQQELDAK